MFNNLKLLKSIKLRIKDTEQKLEQLRKNVESPKLARALVKNNVMFRLEIKLGILEDTQANLIQESTLLKILIKLKLI